MSRWRAWRDRERAREQRLSVARQLLRDAPMLAAINPGAGIEALVAACRILLDLAEER
jgi:hypothetical protein